MLVEAFAGAFEVEAIHGLCVLIPPPYLSGFYTRHSTLFGVMHAFENRIRSRFPFSRRGFLGTRTIRLLVLSIATGLCLFLVDLLFAYGMQALLVGMGAMDASVARLPPGYGAWSLGWILAGVLFIGTLRAVGNWAQVYLRGAADDEATFHQRTKLVRRSFRGISASVGETASLFSAHADAVGSAIASLQTICLQATFLLLMGVSLAFLAPALTSLLVCV